MVYIKFTGHRLKFPYEDVFQSLKIVYLSKQQVSQPKHTSLIKKCFAIHAQKKYISDMILSSTTNMYFV